VAGQLQRTSEVSLSKERRHLQDRWLCMTGAEPFWKVLYLFVDAVAGFECTACQLLRAQLQSVIWDLCSCRDKMTGRRCVSQPVECGCNHHGCQPGSHCGMVDSHACWLWCLYQLRLLQLEPSPECEKMESCRSTLRMDLPLLATVAPAKISCMRIARADDL